MLAGDVFTAHKKRLARIAASHLEVLENNDNYISNQHECSGIDFEDAAAIESCVSEVTLPGTEENAVAYVSGWLEKKCDDDEPVQSSEVKDFIVEVSRGFLIVPHVCT